MKQKIKTSSIPAWVVNFTTPDGKQSNFKTSNAMLKHHKYLMSNNPCIKSFVVKPII